MEQGPGVLHVVVGSRNLLAGPWVVVGPHFPDAVVRHLPGEVGVQLILGDELPLLVDCSEGGLDLFGALHILSLLGDHVGHVILKSRVWLHQSELAEPKKRNLRKKNWP